MSLDRDFDNFLIFFFIDEHAKRRRPLIMGIGNILQQMIKLLRRNVKFWTISSVGSFQLFIGDGRGILIYLTKTVHLNETALCM